MELRIGKKLFGKATRELLAIKLIRMPALTAMKASIG